MSEIVLLTQRLPQAVDNSITEEDSNYIKKFLKDGNVKPLSVNATYKDEIEFIAAVQASVLQIVEEGSPLPKGTTREPKDVYCAKRGACCDRSRVIEKMLRKHCFRTRHVFILYPTDKLKSFLYKDNLIDSHAATEVRTKKGWLFVDSNVPFRLLDGLKNPFSLQKPITLQKVHPQVLKETNEPEFRNRNSLKKILTESYIFLYGLYSRNGQFYPPFAPSSCPRPEINWRELFYNEKQKLFYLLFYTLKKKGDVHKIITFI